MGDSRNRLSGNIYTSFCRVEVTRNFKSTGRRHLEPPVNYAGLDLETVGAVAGVFLAPHARLTINIFTIIPGVIYYGEGIFLRDAASGERSASQPPHRLLQPFIEFTNTRLLLNTSFKTRVFNNSCLRDESVRYYFLA